MYTSEFWFGGQYGNLPTEFARNTKRGATKKHKGCYKKSENFI